MSAELLGMKPTTLASRIKALGLKSKPIRTIKFVGAFVNSLPLKVILLGAQTEASLETELRLPLTAKAANRDYLSYFRPAAPDPLSIALSFQLPPPIFQDEVNRTLTVHVRRYAYTKTARWCSCNDFLVQGLRFHGRRPHPGAIAFTRILNGVNSIADASDRCCGQPLAKTSRPGKSLQ